LLLTIAVSFNAGALPRSHYASSSVLASGKWVKIKVDKEGLYQISAGQLRQWGFENPEKVAVYGYGGVRLSHMSFKADDPDDLSRIYSLYDDDSQRLFFYGEGASRAVAPAKETIRFDKNFYSDFGCYFLTDSEILPLPQDSPDSSDPSHTAVLSHIRVSVIDNDVQNPVGAGVFFHETPMSPQQTNSYSFNISDLDTANPKWGQQIFLRFSFGALGAGDTNLFAGWPSGFISTMSENSSAGRVNSETIKYKNAGGAVTLQIDPAQYPDGILPDGNYTFTLSNYSTGTQSYCAVDRISLAYARKNRMPDDGSHLLMQFIDYTPDYDFVIDNASPGTVVLNVSKPENVYRQTVSYDAAAGVVRGNFDKNYTFSADLPCRLLAFDPASPALAFSPQFVGVVDNQNIHAMKTPQMLIITTGSLEPQARELADIHARNGLDVLVLTQDVIFNEFSSGTPDPCAYSRICKMFFDRDPGQFKYLLLYGPGSWDNRALTVAPADRLLTYQAQDAEFAAQTTTAYCHDGFFGMLDDKFNPDRIMLAKHSIAVGRIPVTDAAKASQINRKIAAYLADTPAHRTFYSILASSDDGNAKLHLHHSQGLIDGMKPLLPPATFNQVHNLIYLWDGKDANNARNAIIKNLQAGIGLFCYSGHGDNDGLTAEHMWNRAYIKATDYRYPPLALLSTCISYDFDHEPDGLAETMLYKENGGMIGVIAAGRSVYMEYNQTFNLAVSQAYATATADETIGDIYRRGHNLATQNAATNLNLATNNICFNLCGDPAVPIPAPSHHIAVLDINGLDVSYCDPYNLTVNTPVIALDPAKNIIIKGQVNDLDGKLDTSFSGPLSVTVYQSPITAQTTIQNPADLINDNKVENVTLDETVLAQAAGVVSDGKFEISFRVPAPVATGATNRIVLTAESHDRSLAAGGIFRLAQIADATANPDPDPAAMPSIVNFYLNDKSFVDGDVVDPSPTVFADIETSTGGLNLSGAIGQAPSLKLDSKRTFSNYAQMLTVDHENPALWHLRMPISDLADGIHTLDLNIADNLGQRVSASLNFIVGNVHTITPLVIIPQEDPADRSKISIDFKDGAPENISSLRLVITDPLGNTILSRLNPTFPFSWDLNTDNGSPAPDGHYRAFITATLTSGKTASSPSLEIPLIR